MPQSFPRTRVSPEELQEDDLIVECHDDDDLQNDDAALGGAILLRHANSRPGSWDGLLERELSALFAERQARHLLSQNPFRYPSAVNRATTTPDHLDSEGQCSSSGGHFQATPPVGLSAGLCGQPHGNARG
jgi:hypothetical protein